MQIQLTDEASDSGGTNKLTDCLGFLMYSSGEPIVATHVLDVEDVSAIRTSGHERNDSHAVFIVVEVDLADVLVLSRGHGRNHSAAVKLP